MATAGTTTGFVAPAGSCDCHMHVFGDPATYPYAEDRRNSPPADPLRQFVDTYLATFRSRGIERMVFVQPSTYGRDNTCMIDAMKALGPCVRGIVDIDETTSEAELARMHQAGVRGVRINAGPPNRPPDASLIAKVLPRLQRMDARCAEIGWQLDLLGPHWLYEQMLEQLGRLQSSFTVAHFGMFRETGGDAAGGFRRFIAFLNQGERRCWVKLTAPYRIANPPHYEEALPVAQALVAAAPDRVIWGSDYPFLSNAHRVNAIDLVNQIPRWIPDEAVRKQVLVDNPARLFGF